MSRGVCKSDVEVSGGPSRAARAFHVEQAARTSKPPVFPPTRADLLAHLVPTRVSCLVLGAWWNFMLDFCAGPKRCSPEATKYTAR